MFRLTLYYLSSPPSRVHSIKVDVNVSYGRLESEIAIKSAIRGK